MSDNDAIEWVDKSWHPVTGCTKIGAGCDNCYAAQYSERFRGVRGHAFENGFDLTLRPERLSQPLEWRRRSMIFVNAMSDSFHKKIARTHLAAMFDTMEKADWHVFQVLTRRASLMKTFVNDRYGGGAAPGHIWFGVSVENAEAASRIEQLRKTRAAVRFLSMAPLIAPVGKLRLDDIHCVLVSGETGPGARPMQMEWAQDILNQCVEARVPFFFKQWGGPPQKTGGAPEEEKRWGYFPQAQLTTKVVEALRERGLFRPGQTNVSTCAIPACEAAAGAGPAAAV